MFASLAQAVVGDEYSDEEVTPQVNIGTVTSFAMPVELLHKVRGLMVHVCICRKRSSLLQTRLQRGDHDAAPDCTLLSDVVPCASISARSNTERNQMTAVNNRAEQPAAGGFNLWGIANAVAETVRKGTAELATTVRDTDWREEIRAFGRDVVEETEELGQSAISVVEHAVEHVEHLPQHVSTHEGPFKRNWCPSDTVALISQWSAATTLSLLALPCAGADCAASHGGAEAAGAAAVGAVWQPHRPLWPRVRGQHHGAV